MKHAVMVIGAAAVLAVSASGCVSNPKKVVLNLDTTDPKWTSRDCVAARKAVHKYHDGDTARAIVSFAGNYAAPYAGTGAALVMSKHQDRKREKLDRWVKDACVTHHHHWL